MSKHFGDTRVWLITGCSSGLGKHLAEAVLASGERVVATARKPSTLDALSQSYPPEQLLVLPLDVTDTAAIDKTFDSLAKQWGRLDVLVNNAGYGLMGEVEGTDNASARAQIEVLFWGAVNMSKKAVTFFRETNPAGLGGRILQISSIGGFIGFQGKAFYHAGKFALEGFTEAFSKEVLPSWNIKMTIVEPGGFRTEWNGSSMVTLPQHPAYDSPESATSKARQFTKQARFKGDPAKAAAAIIKISKLENPPIRIPLGTDAISLLEDECRKVLDEIATYRDIGRSCLADDADEDMDSIRQAVSRQ